MKNAFLAILIGLAGAIIGAGMLYLWMMLQFFEAFSH